MLVVNRYYRIMIVVVVVFIVGSFFSEDIMILSGFTDDLLLTHSANSASREYAESPQRHYYTITGSIKNTNQQQCNYTSPRNNSNSNARVVPRGLPTSPFRILFWSSNAFYNSIMDRWWFHHLYSVKEMGAFYETVLWGPEFEGYNANLSMAENIKNKYGKKDYFDIVYPLWNTIHDAGHMAEFSMNVFYEHESFSDRNRGYFENDKVKVMMFTYQQSLQEYFYQKDALIVHLPHSLRMEIMNTAKCPVEKKHDLVLAGTTHRLRNQYMAWINNGDLKGIDASIFHHPGYTEKLTMAEVNKAGLNVELAEKQVLNFLEASCQGEICMTSTVDPGDKIYAVRKYMEFAAIGCTVVADTPWDRMEEFNSWISVIDPKHMNLQTEQLRLRYLLDNPDVMAQKRHLAKTIVESRYQISHTFEIAYDMFRMRLQHKWTGLIYPFGCDSIVPAEQAFIKMGDSVVYFPCYQESSEAEVTVRCPDPMVMTSSGCVCGEKCKQVCDSCGAASSYQCGELMHCAFTGRRSCLNCCQNTTSFEAAQFHFDSENGKPSEKDIIKCAASIVKVDEKYIKSTNSVGGAESKNVEIYFTPGALTSERPSMEYLLDELVGAINLQHKLCDFSPRAWVRVITKFSIP